MHMDTAHKHKLHRVSHLHISHVQQVMEGPIRPATVNVRKLACKSHDYHMMSHEYYVKPTQIQTVLGDHAMS